MSKIRFAPLLALAIALPTPAADKISDGPLKIGVLTDMSGYYTDYAGPGAVVAAQMAAEDAGGKVLGKPIVIVTGNHQNKADVASNVARRWFDEEQVDVISEVISSSAAGAVMSVAAERKRITLLSGPGTTAFTGEKCTPYNVQYTYNTWSMAHTTGRAVVAEGGDTWFFVTADYSFGKSLEADTIDVVKASGGKVLGWARHPSPGTTDFSSFLLQAQASKAKIVALANGGGDTVNSIKQAKELQLSPAQSVAAMIILDPDIWSVGLDTAKGMYLTTAFYWDLDDATRAWSKRFFDRFKKMPTMFQAGVYSSIRHYLRAVEAAGTKEADAVMAKMRALPVNDFFAKNGRIGPDGLHRHDMYLVRVKSPEESKGPWDIYKVLKTVPASEAFPTVEQQRCPIAMK
jgi:branched-chain amino acid transport system substrate-binding protein